MPLRLRTSSLVFLALGATVAPRAEAREHNRLVDTIRRQASVATAETYGIAAYSVVVADEAAVASVTASLRSDLGEEDLRLVESDAWLHGAAPIGALPAGGGELTLTLYGVDSDVVTTLTGTLLADGTVTLAAESPPVVVGGECASRLGCEGESRGDAVDIDVLAARVFGADGAYELAVDLAGADVYAVAYADLRVVPCDLTSERGICLHAGTRVAAEVAWDAAGAVWAAESAVAHEGVVDVRVVARDADGEQIAAARASVGEPWADAGEGINTLAIDADALTRVGFVAHTVGDSFADGHVRDRMVVVSEGWTLDEAPTHAELTVDRGETLAIPVNSYQRRAREYSWSGFGRLDRYTVTLMVGGAPAWEAPVSALAMPVCAEGYCLTARASGDGTVSVSVTAYASRLRDLYHGPGDVELIVGSALSDDRLIASDPIPVAFDEEVVAVFANEVGFTEDPFGRGLSGRVRLLGAPDARGRQETLARGDFRGVVARDGDGDLTLAADGGGDGSASGAFLVGGDAVGVELYTDEDGDGTIAPPPVAAVAGNGAGTKNGCSQASTKPQLL